MVASASRGSPHRRIKHSRKGQTEERSLERGQEVGGHSAADCACEALELLMIHVCFIR